MRDESYISCIFVAFYVQLIDLRNQHVAHKEFLSAHQRIIHHLHQKFTVDDENIHGEVFDAVLLGIDVDLFDLVFFHIERIVKASAVILGVDKSARDRLLTVGERHIRLVLDMRLQHGVKIKVHHHIGVGHDNVFFLSVTQKVQNICQRARASHIRFRFFFRKRREDM